MNNSSKPQSIKRILIKTLLYSAITAIVLVLASSLIITEIPCCTDCLCITGPQSYRGFPYPYLSNNFKWWNDSLKFLLINFTAYFSASFIVFLSALSLKSKWKSRHRNN